MLLRHLFQFATIVVLLTGLVSAQEAPSQVAADLGPVPIIVPVPMTMEEAPDPALKDKVWHRSQTKNFTILSLDKGQGSYLFENLEHIKRWTFTRWGLPDMDFSAECRVVCVPDAAMMKKLFRVEGSKVESRKEDGKIKLHVIWVVFDKRPTECLPSAMTMVCLTEFEQQHDVTIPFWVRRGMAVLNLSMPQIKGTLRSMNEAISKREKVYFSNAFFGMTREAFLQADAETQKVYDAQATVMCLLFRKEFGQYNFLRFISAPSTEQHLREVIGFRSFDEFDKTFKRYMYYLSQDVVGGQTPREYLEIKAVSTP